MLEFIFNRDERKAATNFSNPASAAAVVFGGYL